VFGIFAMSPLPTPRKRDLFPAEQTAGDSLNTEEIRQWKRCNASKGRGSEVTVRARL